MSLNWNVEKIPLEVRTIVAEDSSMTHGYKAGDRIMNPVTHALIFSTIGVGIGVIDDNTADEFAARLTLLAAAKRRAAARRRWPGPHHQGGRRGAQGPVHQRVPDGAPRGLDQAHRRQLRRILRCDRAEEGGVPMSTPTNDRAAVGQVLRVLKAAGYKLQHVDNGEENVKVATATEAIDAIFEVDNAWLYVLDTDTGAQGWVFFVLGNDPEEVVCDHTVNLSDTLDPLLDSWNA
jgi:hypothetical protein